MVRKTYKSRAREISVMQMVGGDEGAREREIHVRDICCLLRRIGAKIIRPA